MNIKNLSDLERPELEEVVLSTLPTEVKMTDYAREKAYKINELVLEVHKRSYEWYGFLIADADNPELIIDVGIGKNNDNQLSYTSISPEEIDIFRSGLSKGRLINGWIHSHGNLGYHQFSATDEKNHLAVLDYVNSLVGKPLMKREVGIDNLELLVKGQYDSRDLEKGTISLVTDSPITEAKIFEVIMGGFSYAVVIGDSGWHEQEIYYSKTSILTGKEKITYREPELTIVETGRILMPEDIKKLREEVEDKITPPRYGLFRGSIWRKRKSGIYAPWMSSGVDEVEIDEVDEVEIEGNNTPSVVRSPKKGVKSEE